MTGLNGFRHPLSGCVRDRVLADHSDRRRFTSANTRRVQHAHAGAEQRRQLREQLMGSRKVAGDGVTDADSDRRRRGFAFFHYIEMVVERSYFIDLGHRHFHLGREGREMRRGQVAVLILNFVKVLDQEITPPWLIAEKGHDLRERLCIDSPPFRS